MNTALPRHLLAALLLAAAPGFAAPTQGSTGTPQPPMTPGPEAKEPLPFDEEGLAERLHEDNQREIQLAQLTQQKATTKGAKDTAATILKDHQQADEQLQGLADKRRWTLHDVVPLTDAERKRAEMMDATIGLLQLTPPAEYDSLYLTTMVASHDHAIAMTTAAQAKFGGEIRTLLQGLVPQLKKHRDLAYRALGQLRPPPAAPAPKPSPGKKNR